MLFSRRILTLIVGYGGIQKCSLNLNQAHKKIWTNHLGVREREKESETKEWRDAWERECVWLCVCVSEREKKRKRVCKIKKEWRYVWFINQYLPLLSLRNFVWNALILNFFYVLFSNKWFEEARFETDKLIFPTMGSLRICYSFRKPQKKVPPLVVRLIEPPSSLVIIFFS